MPNTARDNGIPLQDTDSEQRRRQEQVERGLAHLGIDTHSGSSRLAPSASSTSMVVVDLGTALQVIPEEDLLFEEEDLQDHHHARYDEREVHIDTTIEPSIRRVNMGEENDDEAEGESTALFRQWGRRFQEQLADLTDAIKHGWTHTGQLLTGANLQESAGLLATSNALLASDVRRSSVLTAEARLLMSAFRIPTYLASLDDHHRLGVPVIFAAMEVKVVHADDIHSPFNVNTTFTLDIIYRSSNLRWRIHRRLFDMIRLHAILTWRHVQGYLPAPLPRFPSQLAYVVDTLKTATTTSGNPNANATNASRSAANSAEAQPSAMEEGVATESHISSRNGHPPQQSAATQQQARRRVSGERRALLTAYFRALLLAVNMNVSLELCEFLEASALSLLHWDGEVKGKEGYLRKRRPLLRSSNNGGNGDSSEKSSSSLSAWIRRWFFFWLPQWKTWDTRWFIVRSSYVAFVDYIDQHLASDVLLCDKYFTVHVESENPLTRTTTIVIGNGGGQKRRWILQSTSRTQTRYWLRDLRYLADTSPWCRSHRFGSYAPVRLDPPGASSTLPMEVQWLIDADSYFSELVRCIQNARQEILIMGWWVSPELYLLRPGAAHPEARLDRLLEAKAKEGVKVYIIVYKELLRTIPINSYHTKTALERLHPNIRVQRHPDHFSSGILLYTHHEKVVIVDREVAFAGGLDLAFGRYDTPSHALTDLAPMATDSADLIADGAMATAAELSIWTGLDYCNPRISDFKDVAGGHNTTLLDRSSTPRMPWHDVQMAIRGDLVVPDLARHFITAWNHCKGEKGRHKPVSTLPFLMPEAPGEFRATSRLLRGERGSGSDRAHYGTAASDQNYSANESYGVTSLQCLRSVGEWSAGLPVEGSILEAYLHYIDTAQHFLIIENQYFITRCSDSLPSHTNGNNTTGNVSAVQNRVGSAIADRIIRAWEEGEEFQVLIFLPLMPAFEADLRSSEAASIRFLMQYQGESIGRGVHSLLGRLQSVGIDASRYVQFLGLRTHARLPSRVITEQIYVHSKLFVVDDAIALIGSANINDRSLLGPRDSEFAVLIEGPEAVSALRKRLLAEHMCIPVSDPILSLTREGRLADGLFDRIAEEAANNTLAYRTHFHCIPDDTVRTWADYEVFVASAPEQVDDQLATLMSTLDNNVRGRIVAFPTHFMEREDLGAMVLAGASFLPSNVFI